MATVRRRGRRSIRSKGYDYASEGRYFITICTKDRACIFADIDDGTIRLSAIGKIVYHEWIRTPDIRPNIELDAFVIMPNHVHGILVVNDERNGNRVGGEVALTVLPHHRTYGSVYGGSVRCLKVMS